MVRARAKHGCVFPQCQNLLNNNKFTRYIASLAVTYQAAWISVLRLAGGKDLKFTYITEGNLPHWFCPAYQLSNNVLSPNTGSSASGNYV